MTKKERTVYEVPQPDFLSLSLMLANIESLGLERV